jgi:hypothetical protein
MSNDRITITSFSRNTENLPQATTKTANNETGIWSKYAFTTSMNSFYFVSGCKRLHKMNVKFDQNVDNYIVDLEDVS